MTCTVDEHKVDDCETDLTCHCGDVLTVDPDVYAAALNINAQIATMTAYGVRTLDPSDVGTVRLVWSNAAAAWYATANSKTNDRFDANEISVKGVRIGSVRAALSYLDPLPLYGNSFEGRMRGV